MQFAACIYASSAERAVSKERRQQSHKPLVIQTSVYRNIPITYGPFESCWIAVCW
jgi:hypothetical protein